MFNTFWLGNGIFSREESPAAKKPSDNEIR
jgi:hypothetical protein